MLYIHVIRGQRELRNLPRLRELRKIAIFVRFVAKWILSKFVAEKPQRELPILRKVRKLQELRKIAIFVKFVAGRKNRVQSWT